MYKLDLLFSSFYFVPPSPLDSPRSHPTHLLCHRDCSTDHRSGPPFVPRLLCQVRPRTSGSWGLSRPGPARTSGRPPSAGSRNLLGRHDSDPTRRSDPGGPRPSRDLSRENLVHTSTGGSLVPVFLGTEVFPTATAPGAPTSTCGAVTDTRSRLRGRGIGLNEASTQQRFRDGPLFTRGLGSFPTFVRQQCAITGTHPSRSEERESCHLCGPRSPVCAGWSSVTRDQTVSECKQTGLCIDPGVPGRQSERDPIEEAHLSHEVNLSDLP